MNIPAISQRWVSEDRYYRPGCSHQEQRSEERKPLNLQHLNHFFAYYIVLANKMCVHLQSNPLHQETLFIALNGMFIPVAQLRHPDLRIYPNHLRRQRRIS